MSVSTSELLAPDEHGDAPAGRRDGHLLDRRRDADLEFAVEGERLDPVLGETPPHRGGRSAPIGEDQHAADSRRAGVHHLVRVEGASSTSRAGSDRSYI